MLGHFRVAAKEREYQFWERNSVSIDLYTEGVFLQKLGYVHNNSVKAVLCGLAEDYIYSSARFYETGIDDHGFLKHFKG